MTDDAERQQPQYNEDFIEEAGWQRPVKPPRADAMAPGPEPKATTPPAASPEKEVSGDG